MKRICHSSPFGDLSLMAHQGRLIYCNWISEDCIPKQLSLEKLFLNETETAVDGEVLHETICQLEEYFSGIRKEFQLPLSLNGTVFQKKVWKLLSSVEYGSTISYKEFSESYGNPKAIRAIAQACGANPIAIVLPCHRIVSSNGKSGGYTGGIDKKLALLALEQQSLNKLLIN